MLTWNSNNFKTEIKSISKKKILWKEEKKNLKTELMKDLFHEIGSSRLEELDKLVDEMVEYTINNIRDERNE